MPQHPASPNITPVCDVTSVMEVTRMTQTRPDLDKRPRSGPDNEEEKAVEGSAGGQPDLYGMLGYRDWSSSSLTTQQWLAVRQIEL